MIAKDKIGYGKVMGILLVAVFFNFYSCNIKKHVPDDRFLLVKNDVELPKHVEVSKSEVKDVIRQRPNHRTLGFRLKLRMYNAVDSVKTERSRVRRLNRYHVKNEKLLKKQEEINIKRIERALKKGKEEYRYKKVDLKDTINPKQTLREKLRYNFGEPPVIYDSLLTQKSKEQIALLMQQKGYFNSEVSVSHKWNIKKREAKVKYEIEATQPFMIDSVYLRTDNSILQKEYENFLQSSKDILVPPFRFDTKQLKKTRDKLAKYMRDNGIYGFKSSYLIFEIDTLQSASKSSLAIEVVPRYDEGEENVIKPFAYSVIKDVNFHLRDTISYKGNFKKEKLDTRNIKLSVYDEISTYDSLVFDWYKGKNKRRHQANFFYNGRLTTKAELIEFQNYLESTSRYREFLEEYSYTRMLNLDIFKTVQLKIEEKDSNQLTVHYYLTPKKNKSFSFEPKGTHSNSFLGLSSSINYSDKNLFRIGHRFKIGVSGGFESQPEVFGKNEDETVLNDGTRSFNTFEIVPAMELDLPGLFPIPLSKLGKSQNPRTIFSTAYGYQQRPEFNRQTIQWKYLWNFLDVYHTQSFKIGLPVIGGIQFVKILPTEEFAKKLQEQNDLFLINAYSNQAIYKDAAIEYTFINPKLSNGDVTFFYGIDFDMAGMIMSWITNKKLPNSEGYKEFIGQRYSQFIRLDHEFRLHHDIDKANSLHYRVLIGAGVPLKNNGISLPFDYSFFGGGSNDNRGFRARTLGPGVYKYYLDTNRTSTEMGDMRLGASFEYRFKISKLFEGAFFTDVGNVWTYNNDPNRQGGQINKDFYKQLSLSSGLGLRLDFTFLILRLDMGVPLHNPSLPDGARWIFQSREPIRKEAMEAWGLDDSQDNYYREKMPKLFQPQFHIAIGYPF